jgi:CheY-like chemotaxis protein
MENVAVLRHAKSLKQDAPVQLLLADDDAPMRSLVASCARETLAPIAVLEAEDGAEAVQLGLQHRPQIALLDINMPKLGGVEVALTLRELQPRMRLALQTADAQTHRDRAREHRLPLFDKADLDRALSWLEVQVEACATGEPKRRVPQKRSLECSSCRYGIFLSTPPERCPMCYAEDAWITSATGVRARDRR